jgi:integral membrane protein
LKTGKLLSRFSVIAIAEGISFLLLLGIAMPLKYLAGIPEAVTYTGWIHGVLFVAFLAMAFEVKSALDKDMIWYAKAFIASVLPFGTFIFDRQLKKEQEA